MAFHVRVNRTHVLRTPRDPKATLRYRPGLEYLEDRVTPSAYVNVDPTANQLAIDPNIYGSNSATQAQVADLNLSVNRLGGNATDTYNWEQNATNHASDFYFESLPNGINGIDPNLFISQTMAGGGQPAITVPILPYIANLGPSGASWSFDVTKYPSQATGTDPNTGLPLIDSVVGDPGQDQAGSGITGYVGTTPIYLTGNDPLDAYIPNSPAFQQAWIQNLINTYGKSQSGGVHYYILGNEPGLWNSTHHDIHPDGETDSELLNDIIATASVIKSLDPGAQILAPEEWGWTNYFVDGADSTAGNFGATYTGIHGEQLNAEQWLLQQLQQYQTDNGTRLLDDFTLHYSPQGDTSGHFEDSNDVSPATELLRNESTRSLWDPNYVDQSWIGSTGINNGIVQLIPMMKSWVNQYYPGTKVGITEYNWGAEGDMNGATAQADVYGIFGREGLDLATRWMTPATGLPTYLAMKLWRNYDGSDSGFGDTSVSASVADPDQVDAFAATRSSDGALTVAVINKNLYDPANPTTTITINLSNYVSTGVAQDWQLAAVNPADQTNAAITHLSDIHFTGDSFTVTVPTESVEMFVLMPAPNAPIAHNDAYAATGGNTRNLSALQGLLANDVAQPPGDPLVVSSVNGVKANVGVSTATLHGHVTVQPDGSFSYVPNAAYTGIDSFTYQATDAIKASDSNTATVDIAVNAPLNLSPATLPAVLVNTAFNQTITLAGGTLPYQSLTVTGFNAGGTGLAAPIVNPGAGTVVTSGTPTAVGTAVFTVNATDALSVTISQVYTVTVTAISLDVDANGSASALTDGILILRYLFGFTGSALTSGAIGAGATRTDPAAIKIFLDGARATLLDADSNGSASPLTDGILILRYLFNFTGSALTSGALGSAATRSGPTNIKTFLDGYNPGVGHLWSVGLGPDAPADDLVTSEELQTITAAAIARWEATDLSATARSLLESAQVQLANLGSTSLGETRGNAILIDVDAAGFGWFVDPTPSSDSEFPTSVGPHELDAVASSPDVGKVDLLTVVMHELGLVMGLPEFDPAVLPHSLMTDVLGTGVRRLPSW